MNITKQNIAEMLAEKQDTTVVAAKQMVEDLIEILTNELKAGNNIALRGFGTLKVVDTKPRKGRNPKTKEVIDIPAGKKVKFSSSAEIHEALNGK